MTPKNSLPTNVALTPLMMPEVVLTYNFYLVAILFIIFDLEVTFLFPWALTLNKTGQFGFWAMMIFLLILTIGFVYEWRKGALDWS